MEDTMSKRKRRIYVDGCAVGGAFNQKYAEQTKPFWDAVQRGEIIVIASDVLDKELQRAPERARVFVDSLPESQVERVVSTDESDDLAERYIAEDVVGKSSLDDCRHIALATIHRADVLVSWNFKHIVNVDRIQGYNGVNMKLGYPYIEIRTPYEVIHDEN
jgi:predicted nucleic acid-binding protein